MSGSISNLEPDGNENGDPSTGWMSLLTNLNIPEAIKKNAIIAVARGVLNVISASTDVAVAKLEAIAARTRTHSQAENKLQKAAVAAAVRLFDDDPELARRALEHYGVRFLGYQQNRESIADKMLTHLRESAPLETVNASIDSDWLNIFWDLAEKKSNVDIQELLARLLTAEISRPGAVSAHTIQLLTILTSPVATAFQRLCNLSIDDGESTFVIHPNVFSFQNIGPLDDFGISYSDLFNLDGVRLIRSAETLMLNYAIDHDSEFEIVDYAGTKASLKLSGKQVHLLQFTQAGRELRGLLALERNACYTEAIKLKLGDEFIPEVRAGQL